MVLSRIRDPNLKKQTDNKVHSILDTMLKLPFREAHILLMLSCPHQKYLFGEISTLEIIVEAGAFRRQSIAIGRVSWYFYCEE